MAKRFRGEGLHKVDAKGRVSIPSSYRRVLCANDPDWSDGRNPTLIIVYGDESHDHLVGYSVEAMEDMEELIEDMPMGSDERDYAEINILGHSSEITADETGRIVLSQKLRDRAGIEKEAYFISKGTTFEIWNPDRYDRVKKRMAEFRAEQPENFTPQSLLPHRSKRGARGE